MADPERRHTGFFWGLLAIAAIAAGYHLDVLRGVDPLRWAYAGIGAMMVLIVVAMSRVSMRIVNDALDERRALSDPDAPEYRARPPRRNLAIFAIALHTTVEFVAPQSPVAAWTALAAAAAVLNLLNDWHVGRALLTRLTSMLYAVYWLMALGYAAIGIALMTGAFGTSAGRHLLAAGAMGLSIYAVLSIAGRIHGGHPLDRRAWVPTGAALVVVAALARAGAGLPGLPAGTLLQVAGVAWVAASACTSRRWCRCSRARAPTAAAAAKSGSRRHPRTPARRRPDRQRQDDQPRPAAGASGPASARACASMRTASSSSTCGNSR